MLIRSRNLRLIVASLVPMCGCGGSAGSSPGTASAAPAADGRQLPLKLDFDSGPLTFTPNEVSEADLVTGPGQALSGRSLHLRRVKEGRYLGASVPLEVKGAKDLRVAFMVRGRAMHSVAVNVFDERRKDNTTPASPARILDGEWRPVVFAVEDFHYNSDPPDQKIEMDTSFVRMTFHGEESGPATELWIDKVVVYRAPDVKPPEPPSAVRTELESDGAVRLTWQEPPDDTFSVVYGVYRRSEGGAWAKVGESSTPTYQDRPAAPGAHVYRITAADYENNVSRPSAEVTATTTAAAARMGGADEPPWIIDRASYAERVRQVHARGIGKVRPDVFLFAGDSITGAMVYTHILGSWLARGITIRQGVASVTAKFGAENTRGYLADARPEFAVVMYGTNDRLSGVAVGESIKNLAAVVDACVEFGTVPIMATIPPGGFDKGAQKGHEEFNRALAQLGREKGFPVSYAFEEMMRRDLKEMLADGVHLQPQAGNDAAGRALRQTMDQVYFALRDTSGNW